MTGVSIVIPTLGRPSLTELLTALGPLPASMELIVVDDRPDRDTPLELPGWPAARVIPGRAAGPAAARNVGWRAATHEWIAFLDDDVLPDPGWAARLAEDLREADDLRADDRRADNFRAGSRTIGGVQGNLSVPLPADRRPTDWERVTAGLADGEWITADMAYRRTALARAGGFDERLPRAFREDAELAHRVREAGFELRRGRRRVTHPVREEHRWVSVRTQRGNADDALLRRLYGAHWRTVLGVPPGRRRRHAAVTAAGAVALAAGVVRLVTGNRTSGAVALAGAALWAAGTAEFAAARIAPGPRDRREVTTMLLTSAAIPPVAVVHWLRGWFHWSFAEPMRPETAEAAPAAGRDLDEARR